MSEKGGVVRVCLVTEEPVIAAGLRSWLDSGFTLSVVSCTDNVPADTQVAILDYTPRLSVPAIRVLLQQIPGVKIIIWGHHIAIEFAAQVVVAGIHGCAGKQQGGSDVLGCVRQVLAGGLYFDRVLVGKLMDVKRVALSPREGQIVAHLMAGHSNKQIAEALHITEGTIKVYLSRLFDKTGQADRLALALHGLRNMGGQDLQAQGGMPIHWLAFNTLTDRKTAKKAAKAVSGDKSAPLPKPQAKPVVSTPERLKLSRNLKPHPARTRPPNADEERWNRVFKEKFEDPTYYSELRHRSGSPLA